MVDLKVRRRNGQLEVHSIDNIKNLTEITGALASKDELSWDGKTWTQKRKLRPVDFAGFLAEGGITATEVASPSIHTEVLEPVDQPVKPIAPSSNANELKVLHEGINGLIKRVETLDVQLKKMDKGESLAGEAQALLGGLRAELRAELEPILSRAETALGNDQQVQKLISDQWGSMERLFGRFQPGTIKALEQERDKLLSQQEGIRSELCEKNLVIDTLESELRRLKINSGAGDLEAIEKGLQNLTEKRKELTSHQELQHECVRLQARLKILESLRETYERVEDTKLNFASLQAENRNLISEREAWLAKVAELQTLKDQRIQAKRTIDQLRMDVGKLNRTLEEERAKTEQLSQNAEEFKEGIKELEVERALIVRERQAASLQEREARKADRVRIEQELRGQFQASLDRGASEFTLAKQKMETLEATNDALKNDNRKLMDDLGDQLRERQQAKEAVQILDLKRRNLQDQCDELGRKLQQYRDELTSEGPAYKQMIDELEAERIRRLNLVEESLRRRNKDENAKLAAMELQIQTTKEELVKQAGEKGVMAEHVSQLRDEIQQLLAQRNDLQSVKVDEEARKASIRTPLLVRTDGVMPELSEKEWLDGVVKRIREAGFFFPQRLIEAFHTSFKIASWSPITALAGVSGTGKSELPRLYAKSGGIHFLKIPVKPNWDSPEDLFGFFNYMDGTYRATELIRALRQSSQDVPFNNQMVMVLLDEMNLARVEQYFSEILSSLGSVRDAKATDRAHYKVDIGTKEPFEIDLLSNVLYVGTMNEDETTHSLSDKVLDRGNVLTFPRPEKLIARGRLDCREVSWSLSAPTWQSWIHEPADWLSEDVRNGIIVALEEVNQGLSYVNRAIGHRVLQAVHAYVANHPRTEKNGSGWGYAFSDQLAQRIMPKLRGLETDSDDGKACINKVEKVLADHAKDLVEDFDIARKSGTFRWDSAKYLEK